MAHEAVIVSHRLRIRAKIFFFIKGPVLYGARYFSDKETAVSRMTTMAVGACSADEIVEFAFGFMTHRAKVIGPVSRHSCRIQYARCVSDVFPARSVADFAALTIEGTLLVGENRRMVVYIRWRRPGMA